MHGCLRAIGMPGTHGGQKKKLDSLELEIQVLVSCHLGVRNQTRVVWKSSQFA